MELRGHCARFELCRCRAEIPIYEVGRGATVTDPRQREKNENEKMPNRTLVPVRFDACLPSSPLVPLAVMQGTMLLVCVVSRVLERWFVGKVDEMRRRRAPAPPLEWVLLTPLSVAMEIPLARWSIVAICLVVDVWAVTCFRAPHMWAIAWVVSTAFMSVALTVYHSWQHNVQSGVLAFVMLPAAIAINTQLVRYAANAPRDAWVALTVVEVVLTVLGFVPYPILLAYASKTTQTYLPALMSLDEWALAACNITGMALVLL